MRELTEPASEERFGELLRQLANGEQAALREIVPLVYTALRRIARRQLARERPGHTLDSIALVNEAFLHFVGQDKLVLNNRAQFLGVSAKIMRRILIDYARARNACKRGGGTSPLAIDQVEASLPRVEADDRLLALNAALERLTIIDAQTVDIVEQRYFAGATEQEVARGLGISPATVRRRWTFAKAWLARELHQG